MQERSPPPEATPLCTDVGDIRAAHGKSRGTRYRGVSPRPQGRFRSESGRSSVRSIATLSCGPVAVTCAAWPEQSSVPPRDSENDTPVRPPSPRPPFLGRAAGSAALPGCRTRRPTDCVRPSPSAFERELERADASREETSTRCEAYCGAERPSQNSVVGGTLALFCVDSSPAKRTVEPVDRTGDLPATDASQSIARCAPVREHTELSRAAGQVVARPQHEYGPEMPPSHRCVVSRPFQEKDVPLRPAAFFGDDHMETGVRRHRQFSLQPSQTSSFHKMRNNAHQRDECQRLTSGRTPVWYASVPLPVFSKGK